MFQPSFHALFSTLAQRRGFREYLTGLLAPRDRNKTVTCLPGAEPVIGAQPAAVHRLQSFRSESGWNQERVNARRVQLLPADPATAPHASGVLVIDDSGDRTDGTATAHGGNQWPGRYGRTDRGILTVTTLGADERRDYPLHAVPYTPAGHVPQGKTDPGFRPQLQIGVELAGAARAAGVVFRAVAADRADGDRDGVRADRRTAGLPFVMARTPGRGVWPSGDPARTPVDAARTWPGAVPTGPGTGSR